MDPLPPPQAAAPLMYGAPAPPGELLPWEWAESRLVAAQHYWIATTRPDGTPHSRPVWGVWLADGFWFSTGSLAVRNLAAQPALTVHLEDGRAAVIVEGLARPVTDGADLERMCEVYSAKYSYPVSPCPEGITDGDGNAGPAYLVRPAKVFGWDADMHAPTRWTFAS
ncbi:pyridoxamine 5'-phosphate oxidase family protein [Streptomyces sp. TRM66268-LWL]|uniref:Pyridoxamine 5'-phosphate oxidase family protein n=1 Tax=Streptomyces polyasparticus TaxID=2767826 RepID=A0ABR7S8F4_9ACTN|nr:pyridoxamine 5'-phosphate oxidase family protein [Streptomyces polyasparticus]MBC9711242.1 pyridoxamine 5'-phosphate oxidase family protein [Streptomyces polyasparticus]